MKYNIWPIIQSSLFLLSAENDYLTQGPKKTS